MGTYSLAPLVLIFPLVGLFFNALVGRRFVQPWRYGADPQESGSNDATGETWSGWIASAMAL